MIRRDYIIRMIEEFIQALARISALKKGQLWREADAALDAEFQRMLSAGPAAAAKMSETELLAKLIQGDPTQVVHHKALLLTTLLREAGDVAVAQNRTADGRACYLKGLNLLLETLARADDWELPDFVPKVEVFLGAMQDSALPLETQARLMQHFERVGAFGKAEDILYAMLEADPNEPRLLDFGIAFYQRLKNQADSSLIAGNLPRTELETGLAEFEQRKAGISPASGR